MTGLLDYFPEAIAYLAWTSKVGNDQHNLGEKPHWDKSKSTDHADCLVRHLLDRGTLDKDNVKHTAKVAWRALAMLQIELENDEASTNESRTKGCGSEKPRSQGYVYRGAFWNDKAPWIEREIREALGE